MSSKEKRCRKNKSRTKQKPLKSSYENPDRAAPQQAHPATIMQQARHGPHSLPSHNALQLQRTIGNQAVRRLLAQRQPIQKKGSRKGGTAAEVADPAAAETYQATSALVVSRGSDKDKVLTINDFDPQSTTALYVKDTKTNIEGIFVDIYSSTDETIMLQTAQGTLIYNLKTETFHQLDTPATVEMDGFEVKKEVVEGSSDYHVGMAFDMTALDTNEQEVTFASIKEVVDVKEISGFFQENNVKPVSQEFFGKYNKGGLRRDFLTVSSNSVEALDALREQKGKAVHYQYIEYLDERAGNKPIKNSGYLLTKELKDGKMIIKREPMDTSDVKKGKTKGATNTTINL